MIVKTTGKKLPWGCLMIFATSSHEFQYHPSANNIRLALCWPIRFTAKLRVQNEQLSEEKGFILRGNEMEV